MIAGTVRRRRPAEPEQGKLEKDIVSIKIIIADDHELVRQGLRKIVQWEPDMGIVGEAFDTASALEMVAALDADILILDLSMDNGHNIGVLERIHELRPRLPILVLSMQTEEQFGVRAIKAGAAGYVTKGMAATEVVKAIRKIVDGGRYVGPRQAELLAQEVASPPPRAAHESLTHREMQVFELLGAGQTIKQVAGKLGLSISSVNTYRLRIFSKMNLTSNAGLIRYAVQHGLSG
ncbi:MAG: response regulator [Telluria sp.]